MQDEFLEVQIAWLPRCCLANFCFAFLAHAGYIWSYPTLFTLHPRFRAFICDVEWVMVSIFCYLPMYRLFHRMSRLRLEYYLLTLFPWGCPLYVCLIYYRHTCIVHVNLFIVDLASLTIIIDCHMKQAPGPCHFYASHPSLWICAMHMFMDSSWIILILCCTTCNETYSMKAYNRFWFYLEDIFAVCLLSHVIIDRYDSKF